MTNTVLGNVYQPFFSRQPAPPRHNTAAAPAPVPLQSWSMPALPPPPYAPSPNPYETQPSVHTPFRGQAQPRFNSADIPAQTAAWGNSARQERGGWCAKPVSPSIVGPLLSRTSQGRSNTCPTCHQRAGPLGNHRHFECPVNYARVLRAACPGFTASGQRVASAWDGDDITDETKQAWATYIRTHNLAVSKIEEQCGAIDFATSRSGRATRGSRRDRRGRESDE